MPEVLLLLALAAPRQLQIMGRVLCEQDLLSFENPHYRNEWLESHLYLVILGKIDPDGAARGATRNTGRSRLLN